MVPVTTNHLKIPWKIPKNAGKNAVSGLRGHIGGLQHLAQVREEAPEMFRGNVLDPSG
jgi:hypothetical protein